MNFFEYVQNHAIEAQERTETEYIDDEALIKAFVLINEIQYENVYDIFLGLSALNLINAYANKKGAKLSYLFKAHLVSIYLAISEIHPSDLEVFFTILENRNNCIYFVFNGFQYSFQKINECDIPLGLVKNCQIEWDGIRKQQCALSLFNIALDCKYLSPAAKDVQCLFPNEISNYYNGLYRFHKGSLVKLDKPISENDYVDSFSKQEKNYYRDILREYKDKRIIVTGKFKAIYPEYITFSNIRPYIEGYRTKTICDHINLLRTDVEKVISPEELLFNRKYFICGYCKEYGLIDERMGINLAFDIDTSPLFIKGDSSVSMDLLAKCCPFDPEKYAFPKISGTVL